MNLFFDVDDTIVTWDVKLRPFVHEVFRQLRADGHTIYLWSGYGPRWEVVRRFDLAEYVEDCFWKPLHNHHKRLEELGVPFVPDFVVDDHQDIIDVFPGVLVEPASAPYANEREMWRVYDEICAYAARRNGDGARPETS